MQCHQCHSIEGMQLPEIPGRDAPYVELGGKVTKIKTYGELLTAIIYPSHELADGYAEEVVSNAALINALSTTSERMPPRVTGWHQCSFLIQDFITPRLQPYLV
jgi:hypothetical protein